ncbi:MAG: oxygen-independent coproporphyrinogen III oxidase [Rubrimonas sp.]
MDPVLARYAARPAPRYTSYPTVPHFTVGFPAETYAGWLAALDPATPVSLYLHVPFCRQMCWYCGCNMKLAARYAPVAAYVDSLLAEIDLVAARMPGRMPVGRIHWGGGTPTALEPEDLARVMTTLRSRFAVLPGAEVAIESDPRTLTGAMVAMLGALGFTRASFGVQEFDPAVQGAINRVQPPEMVADAVSQLRDAGIRAINFDLIYGLPHQTVASLKQTVRRCIEMKPQRIALFGYAHVPWIARNQRMIDEAALPGALERAAQAEAAARELAAAGYTRIGLDHFARPEDGLAVAAAAGRLRRNFQGYTDDQSETLVGLGATAIGRAPGGHVQNIAETGAYGRCVAEGRLPVAKGWCFQGEDLLRAAVIERLMCEGAADVGALGRRFGAAPGWWADARAALEELRTDGMVEIERDQVRLTPRGQPLARLVAAAFDSHLARSAARHSVAV